MKRKYRDIDGIWMHWRELGAGMPVILVHGFATSPSLWRFVMPQIQHGHCLAWEMIGYGGSIPQGAKRDLSVARQAVYLLNWLKALRIKRAVLVGHGLGGGVVQVAVRRHPTLCAGLVLVNSVGYDSWPPSALQLACRVPMLTKRVPERLLRFAFRRFLRTSHTRREDAAKAFALYWPYYARHGAGPLVRQMRHLDLRDTRNAIAALQRLDVPMRVVWGARDRLLPVAYGFRFARDLDATFQYIFQGRHFTPEDHPEVVAEAVNGILSEISDANHLQQDERTRRYG